MSPASEDDRAPSSSGETPGVLSNLPSTRPQRSSARREAARKAASANGAAKRSPEGPAAGATTKPATVTLREKKTAAARRQRVGPKLAAKATRSSTKRTSAGRAGREPVPIQGFECDSDRASGPVQPPGSSELAASAVEIVGELAKAGFSRTENLIKDVLGRLPLS